MQIRGKLMKLDAIWTKRRTVLSVGGPVLIAEVMLEPAVIIGAHDIAVMTVQAFRILWQSYKFMRNQRTARVLQVAGSAPRAPSRFRIRVAIGKKMTAQTAPPQKVFSKFKGRLWIVMNRQVH